MVKTSGWVCNTKHANCGKKWPSKNMFGCFTTIKQSFKTTLTQWLLYANPWTHSGLPFGLTHLDESLLSYWKNNYCWEAFDVSCWKYVLAKISGLLQRMIHHPIDLKWEDPNMRLFWGYIMPHDALPGCCPWHPWRWNKGKFQKGPISIDGSKGWLDCSKGWWWNMSQKKTKLHALFVLTREMPDKITIETSSWISKKTMRK